MQGDLVTPGQFLRISAKDWNEVRARLRNQRAGGDRNENLALLLASNPSCVIRVQNTSTTITYPAQGVVGLSTHGIDPAVAPVDNALRPVALAAMPDLDVPYGIALYPIQPSQTGYVVVAGVTSANIEVTDIAHEYAVCIDGDNTKLTTATSGPIRLLSRFGSTSSNAVGLVFVGVMDSEPGDFSLGNTSAAATGTEPSSPVAVTEADVVNPWLRFVQRGGSDPTGKPDTYDLGGIHFGTTTATILSRKVQFDPTYFTVSGKGATSASPDEPIDISLLGGAYTIITGNVGPAASGSTADEATGTLYVANETGVGIKTDTSGVRVLQGIEADVAQVGMVSTDAQSMSGDKEFIDRFRFGLNYVSDGPRTGSPHEGHDGIGEAFSLGWGGGSDRYANFFKGGTSVDGDSPGKLKVWDRVEAVLRFMCNGLDGETGATTNGYKPVFEGGIKVDETADQPTYYNGVSTTAFAPTTAWSVVTGIFSGSAGWEFSGVWPVRMTIMFLLHTDIAPTGADVVVKMRLVKSTDSGATWTYVNDTEFNVAYITEAEGEQRKFACYSVIVPAGSAYRLRPEMIRDDPGVAITCQFTNNYSTFALNEIR